MPSLSVPASNSPVTLANSAVSATTQGSWLTGVGAALNNVSATMASAYQTRVAFNNAALAKQDAQSALEAGTYSSEVKKLQTGELVGSQKAAQAANNVDVNSGSPAAVRNATQHIGDLDAAMIMYNAKRQAYADMMQSKSYRAQGNLGVASTLFGATGRGLDVYKSFISGSTALTGQGLGFGMQGVPSYG